MKAGRSSSCALAITSVRKRKYDWINTIDADTNKNPDVEHVFSFTLDEALLD